MTAHQALAFLCFLLCVGGAGGILLGCFQLVADRDARAPVIPWASAAFLLGRLTWWWYG